MPTPPDQPDAPLPIERHFDGVLCFGGEDWWYHNRGHFDMRMMRELSAHCPVIYVNSIGMRVPSPREGSYFLRRVRRKCQSIRRGFESIDERFSVGSLFSMPGRIGRLVSRRIALSQLTAALRARGIYRPLIWVACPTAAELLPHIPAAGLVYQRTDEYEHFPGVNESRIRAMDRQLKAAADLTVFCSSDLARREWSACLHPLYVEHGVDFERFAAAGAGLTEEPDDLARIPGPRVGFVGGIDAHTFDASFFDQVTTRLPWVHFVLVGSCSIPGEWCDRPNVHMLGQRAYDDVAEYMAANDVLIMPWRQNEWIRSCNPVKLKEYLAVGRPIVSTPFPQLTQFDDLVRTAATPSSFADEIRDALEHPGYAMPRRARVAGQTWAAAAERVTETLRARGVAIDVVRIASAEASSLIRHGEHVNIRLARRRSDKAFHVDERISACIILAGGLAPATIEAETRRSTLDQQVCDGQRVLDVWIRALGAIREVDRQATVIRVIHGVVMPGPWPAPPMSTRDVRHERDARPYRGTAGSLADACRGMNESDTVVVAEGSRLPLVSLQSISDVHFDSEADITIATNEEGSPAGLYAVRVAALSHVATRGYFDLKEQWLTRAVRAGLHIETDVLPGAGCVSVDTRDGLVRARHLIHARRTVTSADHSATHTFEATGRTREVRTA